MDASLSSGPAAKDSRIASIVRAQALIFDSPLFGLELGIDDDYEALLNYPDAPDWSKLRAVASILAAHRELFGSGPGAVERQTAAEVDELIRYLASLDIDTEPEKKRAAILPRNLGLPFARKGLGVPLFGMSRPPSAPTAPGVLLEYQAVEADGCARLAATRLDGRTLVAYDGLGAVLETGARWLHCALAAAGKEPGPGPRGAFPGGTPSEYHFDHYSVYLATRAAKAPARPETRRIDPRDYRYLYYFWEDASLNARLGRYLGELLRGSFGIPPRKAEELAGEFIERLP